MGKSFWKEKARIRDNGLSPATFDIIVELTGKQWRDWLDVLPSILPKGGQPRQAFTIIHPFVNAYGIDNIYIHKLKAPAPSARKGMRIEIHCGEWMEEEKEAKTPSKSAPKSLVPAYGTTDYTGKDYFDLARAQNNAGFPDGNRAEQNALSNLFEDQ